MIFYLTAEATRLERALTQPDDQDDDLSLEPDNTDENIPDGIRTKPVEKASIPQTATEASRAPKKNSKQAAKQKSSGKTTAKGMYSQYLVSSLHQLA